LDNIETQISAFIRSGGFWWIFLCKAIRSLQANTRFH